MRFFASKKRFIFSLSCVAVFGVAVLVPNVAFAQLGFLGGIADGIGKAIGGIIAGFLLAIPSAILGIASLMLSLVIDPFFIRLPYTTGPIVDAGWTVVRDLANMLIVFFLIIIGLGTALRLRQYEAQTTLRNLIFVALLINFTPVITGFIVDVSNIFMNFFLEGVAGAGILGSIFTSIASGLSNDVPNFINPVEAGGFIIKILLIGMFEIFAAIVFFLFAALFIVRRIAIWILVILSPIAFVASVLPGTAGLFKMWWSQFFQWSIIGIFAAFFLWLGDQIISVAASGTLVAQAPPENFAADMINEVMPFGIALAMLLVGFFVALTASGTMGAGVIGFAQKQGKAGLAAAGTRGAAFAKERWAESPGARAAAKLASIKTPSPGWGQGRAGPIGWAQRRGAGAVNAAATPYAGVARTVGRVAGPGVLESQKSDIGKAEEAMKKRSVAGVASVLRGTGSITEKIGAVNRIIKEPGDLDEALKKELITQEEIQKIYERAKPYDAHKDMLAAMPQLAEVEMKMETANIEAKMTGVPSTIKADTDISKFTPGQRATFKQTYKDDILSKIPSGRASNISATVLKNNLLMEVIVETWHGNQIGKLVERHGREGVDSLQNAINRIGGEVALTALNPGLLKYLKSNTGQAAGFTI